MRSRPETSDLKRYAINFNYSIDGTFIEPYRGSPLEPPISSDFQRSRFHFNKEMVKSCFKNRGDINYAFVWTDLGKLYIHAYGWYTGTDKVMHPQLETFLLALIKTLDSPDDPHMEDDY